MAPEVSRRVQPGVFRCCLAVKLTTCSKMATCMSYHHRATTASRLHGSGGNLSSFLRELRMLRNELAQELPSTCQHSEEGGSAFFSNTRSKLVSKQESCEYFRIYASLRFIDWAILGASRYNNKTVKTEKQNF